MAGSDDIIVTLEAEAGNKWDKDRKSGAIGNYSPGASSRRSSWHMVFMPDGVVPGQNVRLLLREIKADTRGNMMYRGVPAPILYTERWKDNGDGTASKVTISTDWLGNEAQEGVMETRSLANREQNPSVRQDLKVTWGSDQASSFVEKVETKSYRQEIEKVHEGQIVWVGTGTREEQGAPERLPVVRVTVNWQGNALTRLELVYKASQPVTVSCYHSDTDRTYAMENTEWGKLQAWVQQEALACCPICSGCGKVRYHRDQMSWCVNCAPYREAEKLIADLITPQRLEELAGEAARLIGGLVFQGEAGMTVLRATVDHLPTGWTRDRIVQEWTGYGWYYFTDEGVYGSKFSPAALQIFQFLPHANGNGLVDMVAWFDSGHKPSSPDYYTKTQVSGEKTALPQLQEVIRKLVAKEMGLAVRLRGSEADRIAALEGYGRLTQSDGDTNQARHARAVASILQDSKQDYATALVKIREAEAELTVRKQAPRAVSPAVSSRSVPSEPPPVASSGEFRTNSFGALAELLKDKK